MSPKAQAWALEIVCDSGVQKSVLMYLANRYNEQLGYAFPSIARIAKETCWSKSAVENALKGLKASGLIQTNKQYSPSDGSYSSNRYYLIGYSVLVPEPHEKFSKTPSLQTLLEDEEDTVSPYWASLAGRFRDHEMQG